MRTYFRGGVLEQWSLSLTQSGLDAVAQSINELKKLIQTSGGGVKRVQRGTTSGATTVTIDAVDMSKAVVLSVSKGSAGYVAARGSITLHSDIENGTSSTPVKNNSSSNINKALPDYNGSITGGTTDLTTKQYSAKLISATQLQTDGPVEWQVIEYA